MSLLLCGRDVYACVYVSVYVCACCRVEGRGKRKRERGAMYKRPSCTHSSSAPSLCLALPRFSSCTIVEHVGRYPSMCLGSRYITSQVPSLLLFLIPPLSDVTCMTTIWGKVILRNTGRGKVKC